MYQTHLKDITDIEQDFFEIDKKKKVARIVLDFEKPSDIFDTNYVSKIPVLSDDFLDWIDSAFRIIPKKYKIKLDICFDDMEGFDAAGLEKIFAKNMLLEHRSKVSARKRERNLAWSLIGLGMLLLFSIIFLNLFWQEESIRHEIILYVLDIASTVTFWEAFTILIVKRQEIFGDQKDLISRFASISFHASEKSALAPK